MVKSERTGRPTGNSFVINLIYTKILVYRKKYKLTSWNAWNKLAEHKAFKDLMKEFYKGEKNKDYYGVSAAVAEFNDIHIITFHNIYFKFSKTNIYFSIFDHFTFYTFFTF